VVLDAPWWLMLAALTCAASTVAAADKPPNILILWGDDIGQFQANAIAIISIAYNMGMMGYKTKPGTIINDIGAHEDMIPTVMAAAGEPDIKEELLKGKKVGDTTYKVHLDGYNLRPFFKGDVTESPRHAYTCWRAPWSRAREGNRPAQRRDPSGV